MGDGATDSTSRGGFQIVHKIILDTSRRRRWRKKDRSDGSHDLQKMDDEECNPKDGMAQTNAIRQHLAMRKDFVRPKLSNALLAGRICMYDVNVTSPR
jgi:hypothetical protein